MKESQDWREFEIKKGDYVRVNSRQVGIFVDKTDDFLLLGRVGAFAWDEIKKLEIIKDYKMDWRR